MVLQRLIIRLLLALQDLHNDRREAFAVEVHFLVVGDLANVAVGKKEELVSHQRDHLLWVFFLGPSCHARCYSTLIFTSLELLDGLLFLFFSFTSQRSL